MPEQSLLTDEVRAQIGKTSAPVTVQVSRKIVRRSLDLYLGHHDRELEEGKPVPGLALVALQPEAEGVSSPELLPNSLLISNEMLIERPLLLGETLTVQSRLADINERFGGRFGYSIYIRTETEFRDEGGRLVATMANTMMYYDAAEARDGGEEQ
jgi:hypothetical protein